MNELSFIIKIGKESGVHMKKFLTKFQHVFLTSSSYIFLFMVLVYFFAGSLIPIYTILFYLLFYLLTFFSYQHKTFRLDGRFHIFLILASSILFTYVYQLLDISFEIMTYIYFIEIVMFFTLMQALVILAKPIWQYLLTGFMLIIFLFVISLMIIHGLEANLLFIGLGLLKLIPYTISYTISQTKETDFRNVFYVIIFLPLIIVQNILSLLIKNINYLSIKEKMKQGEDL